VTVAVTPNGWADAVSDDGRFFMLPEERQMHFADFLDCLCDRQESSPIYYMQQQNSNLTGEMKALIGDVPEDVDWATRAFGQNPDAANFWLGDERAVTSSKFFHLWQKSTDHILLVSFQLTKTLMKIFIA